MSQLVLRQDHLVTMRDHVAGEAPLEACGLVAGRSGYCTGIFSIRNEEASPTRFRMDAKQQYEAFVEMEKAGWELLAIYHSHPKGPAEPSQTDLSEAFYPGVVHLIWSPLEDSWHCLGFLLEDNRATRMDFRILDK